MTTLEDIKSEMLNLPQKSYGWWVQTPWKEDDTAIEYIDKLIADSEPADEDTTHEIIGIIDGTFDEKDSRFEFGRISNSYNWNSCIIFEFGQFFDPAKSEIYCAIRFHLGGDVRGNYSDWAVVKVPFNVTDFLSAEITKSFEGFEDVTFFYCPMKDFGVEWYTQSQGIMCSTAYGADGQDENYEENFERAMRWQNTIR